MKGIEKWKMENSTKRNAAIKHRKIIIKHVNSIILSDHLCKNKNIKEGIQELVDELVDDKGK
jgi:predicted metallo-beta-lactamase superfamily hydrolase